MNLYPLSIALLILCFTTLMVHDTASTYLAADVSIDCGSTGNSASINGTEWMGDTNSKLSSVLHITGSSTISPVIHKKLISPDDSLYNTARLSKFRFSYAFKVNPGQKIIRFRFNPTQYKGFKGLRDLFTVEARPFTLLGNFSASLVAEDLAVNYFVKEFCLFLHEDEQLNIVFTPATTPSLNTYAFINGIEIISVPSDVSYFHGGDNGVQLVGHKHHLHFDYSTALERIHRLVINHNSLQDVDGIFPGRLARKGSTLKNSTWRIPVDMGFRYLIRLHLSEWGHKILGSGNAMFDVFINEIVAYIHGMAKEQNGSGIPWYMDYMVMMRGQKEEVKHDLFISVLLDHDKFGGGHGPLAAIEVLKLSNYDNSLAAPNPLPRARNSLHWTILTPLLVLGQGNVVATLAVIVICLINIVFQKLREVSEAGASTDEILVKVQRVCRQFSLSEIKLATRNFSDGLQIGRGGFGKVYKGFIDNGKTVIAVKRLNPSSSQGAHEFLIEIKTLSELRHFNLVSLCGYCCAAGEMILVYDYMVGGTLAHHLFKLPSDDNENCSPLTWKQRLNICIGAARGLDYLHTGHGVIHRDVKSSNILLDENFVAKVSDFGLARYEDRNKMGSHVSTKIKGTKGYWDPHYISTGKLTRKSDTYAFGVVLLETLCGRRAVDESLPEDEHILIYWARENINKGNVYEIVASNLRDEISERSLKAFVGVAERCVDSVPKKRPTMGQVVVELESALELQDEHDLMSNKVVSGSDGKIGKLVAFPLEVENVTPCPKDQTRIEAISTVLEVDDKQKPSPSLSEQRDVEMVTKYTQKHKKAWARRFWPWSLDAIRIGVKPLEKLVEVTEDTQAKPFRHFSLRRGC